MPKGAEFPLRDEFQIKLLIFTWYTAGYRVAIFLSKKNNQWKKNPEKNKTKEMISRTFF